VERVRGGPALVILASLVCLIWIYLVFGRKGFWRVGLPERTEIPVDRPTVCAVIPARNEAEVVGRSVGSLAASDYPLKIFLVDDHSTDGTAEAAGRCAGVTVLQARALEAGWTGKLWAVSQGIEAAARVAPDYYLLTDADIEHAPDNVSQLVARAQAGRFDMVSLMVKLRCESLAEKALIPAFVFFFFKLYPPGAGTSGAAGGCILIRRTALERIGGLGRIRGELIDDCALAREVKSSGGRLWLGVTQTTRSIRPYPEFRDVEQMIARTAFTQLGYSGWMLAGAVLGMFVVYLLPVILFVMGYRSAWAAVALMIIAYIPILRFYGRSVLWAAALPLVAMFYTGATVHSAILHWTGRGGFWKGRVATTASGSPRPASDTPPPSA
jgi:hopene-associated glycosyltransferase HpnB